ncbi:UNVERIFIED_CONTAM: hypothetical protein FKN15_043137 [Acipenser sinensis]
MGGRRGKMGEKRRKSCRELQQQQLCKRWWSRLPSQFGTPDWAAEQEQWRAEGAPMCDACGEFGHDREDCPYGESQYEEAWNQGLVGDAAEWFWAVDQTRPRPAPEKEEPLPPSQPEGEEPLPPSQPEGEEPLPPSPPEGEAPSPEAEQQELPLPPPPPPVGEKQELPLPSRQDKPGQEAGGPQPPLHRLLSRARGNIAEKRANPSTTAGPGSPPAIASHGSAAAIAY